MNGTCQTTVAVTTPKCDRTRDNSEGKGDRELRETCSGNPFPPPPLFLFFFRLLDYSYCYEQLLLLLLLLVVELYTHNKSINQKSDIHSSTFICVFVRNHVFLVDNGLEKTNHNHIHALSGCMRVQPFLLTITIDPFLINESIFCY